MRGRFSTEESKPAMNQDCDLSTNRHLINQDVDQAEPNRMQCMEVWGGNQAVERSFQTPGLKIWVYSRPYGQAVGGGDVYYISSCASGRITRMLLADVSGHGELVAKIAETTAVQPSQFVQDTHYSKRQRPPTAAGRLRGVW